MVGVPVGLRGRLAVVLAVALVPAIAMLTFERIDQSRQRTADMRDQVLALARLAAQAQQRRIEGARQLLIALSRSSELHGDPATCTRFVRELAAEYAGTYREIGRADLSGRVTCRVSDMPAAVSIADRVYFKRAVETGSFVSGELMNTSGPPTLGFAHPARDASGAMTGVVFATVDLRALGASMKADVRGEGATVALVDRRGAVLARSADAGQYIGVRGTPEQVRVMSQVGELATEFPGPDSIVRAYGVVTIRDAAGKPEFFVAVGLPRAPVVAAARRRLYFDLLIVAMIGTGLLVACWVGSDYLIRRPVDRLLATTASFASGRLDARVSDVGGVRELEVLGTALNDMAAKLQQRDVHLRRGQRLEAIGQLAGGIAHDFNNLLTVIIGYGDSLRQRLKGDADAVKELWYLTDAADRAAALTQQLLAFSRQQVLQPRPVNLNDIVAQMKPLVARTIGDDIQLVTTTARDLGIVLADQAQLEQVILNLAINARDAMPEGGMITIETANVELTQATLPPGAEGAGMPGGSYVTVSVADTGIGMDDHTRARIFEPFFTTKGQHGTGLGLATVYGIVKQSDGFIFCDSAPGCGTRMTVYLPRSHRESTDAEPQRRAAPAGGTEAVLVAEDEAAVGAYIHTVLTRAGYRVGLARDGREAAARLASEAQVDLLITDVKMPGMNGRMLHDHARALNPALPVLFISGYAQDALTLDSSLPGEVSFLQKPFMAYDLLAKVRETLDACAPA